MMIDPNMQHNQTPQQAKTVEIVSVSDFFEQINWYGKNLADADGLMLESAAYGTVGHFFSTFPWRGSTSTLPSDNVRTDSDSEVFSIEEDDTLTLEDLSALF
ncbi:hypothetical protein [Leptothoe spongobia]|uniref:Uncharacterized protein n=1 Tax=Leptothoe spongobia TAU-MAC 1115 TaxID=1967444 RepID=A0A947DFK1_9CYAN|nr:hypothetical protein [Leptothoe spongobia]MBT9316127.1 hypothetical protein [Leptothoe spongobia TAU-MAC 1115]